YYDLLAHREKEQRADTAILRIEQLYPLHTAALQEAAAAYPKAERFVWCQEEPQNMGAWTFIAPRLGALFHKHLAYAGRGEAASPAVGALALHRMEQKQLVQDAFQ
ncbi:MAG: 2-oxoglutarate dehydrogenase E1 component, partial [Chthoniobacteraceae bacterium]|nr:2-oxoglutarate dehydrogenase E1 component [Chthoniobacteraceae bacterium]